MKVKVRWFGLVVVMVVILAVGVILAGAYTATSPETMEKDVSAQEELSLPSVHNMEDLTDEVQKVMETLYAKDFSHMERYGSWETEGLNREVIDVAFMGQENSLPYLASVDPATQTMIAIETVADPSDRPATKQYQEQYIQKAEQFLFEQMGVSNPGEPVCRLPAPNGNESANSVYVFFPELALYVEISAAEDLHFIGYRTFENAKEVQAFMQVHSRAL